MNEFEWRRQLRELRQPQLPGRDLWASIDAALSDAVAPPAAAKASPIAAVRRTRHPLRWLAAAALLLTLGAAGSLGWQQLRAPMSTHLAAVPSASSSTANPAPWKPADPRLAGAAIELDAAHMELRQALRQSPDSTALQRLLLRTERQQAQLRQLAREAG